MPPDATSDPSAAARLAKWSLLFVLVNQVAFAVIAQLATSVDVPAQREGIAYGVGFTAYTYALPLFQLPHAVVTVSVAAATLAAMSRSAARDDRNRLREELSRGLRLNAVAVVPAALGLMVLGPGPARATFGGQGADGAAKADTW